jgi:solute carrier family 25 folate transporter 32
LKDIYVKDSIRGLYRGVGQNVVGNASSWGLYFLL